MNDDRFYFSPDVGYLVWRGDNFYTEYGEVISSNAIVRMMPIDSVKENYADWSDAKRRKVRKAVKAENKAAEAKEKARIKARDALAERARAKLTEAEFDAVWQQGWAQGRYYE